jgi:hypothetical protein
LDATTHAHVVPAKNTNIAAANKTYNTSWPKKKSYNT